MHKRTICLDSMTLKDGPLDFSHSFIDKGAAARVPVSVFNSLLKHQVTYQIVNMRDEETFRSIAGLNRVNFCHGLTGWFTMEASDAFRNYALQRIGQRVQCMLQIADVPIEPVVDHADNIDLAARVSVIEQYWNHGNEEVLHTLPPPAQSILQWMRKYKVLAASSASNAVPAEPVAVIPNNRPQAQRSVRFQTNERPISTSQPAARAPASSSSSAGHQQQAGVAAFDIFQEDDSGDSEDEW